MTTPQFFMILATIYLAHDTSPDTRKVLGVAFVVMALLVEFVL